MEAVKLEQVMEEQIELIFAKRCENCKVRPKHHPHKWCEPCINRYYRKEKMTPERVDKITIKLVEPLYANATLDDIDPEIREKILNRESSQDLYLFGLPGRGKTHTMAALIRHYVAEGYNCKRICFDDFCCEVRSTISPASKQTERDMTEPLKEVDMLFIDDLGLRSKQETDFAYITFYTILNKRQERLLPTFISSNKNLDRLRQTFDERICSRLNAALIIELTGEDKRKMFDDFSVRS